MYQTNLSGLLTGKYTKDYTNSIYCLMILRAQPIVESKAGERGGGGAGWGGGQNTRGPECSKGPGNLGKMFVLFIIALCLS
jgi:hypothetical protein